MPLAARLPGEIAVATGPIDRELRAMPAAAVPSPAALDVRDTQAPVQHGIDEPCTLQVIEPRTDVFDVTCRMLSGKECKIQVTACSRLYDIKDKAKRSFNLPPQCLINLYDSWGPLRRDNSSLVQHGIYEHCTLQVIELRTDVFDVTCRMLSGKECKIQVTECSRLYDVTDKAKRSFNLPPQCLINLYDSKGCALSSPLTTLEEVGIVEPCTLLVQVWAWRIDDDEGPSR
jgi:hypothetical protein